jgi:hypothetical protein
MVVIERYLKANQGFSRSARAAEGTENRITVARNRYISRPCRNHNVLARGSE